MSTTSLKFLRNHGCYPKGIIATFPGKIAHELIDKKIAVEVVEPVDEHKNKKTKVPLHDRHTTTKSIITK